MKSKLACLMLFSAMVTSSAVHGKSPTVALSITGPGLTTPIRTSNADAIAVSVWGGDFVDWDSGQAAEPAAALPRYRVHFWVEGGSGARIAYVVRFAWNPRLQQGLVHFPGRRDHWYRTNVYSILRDGQDGNWYHATGSWGTTLNRLIEAARG